MNCQPSKRDFEEIKPDIADLLKKVLNRRINDFFVDPIVHRYTEKTLGLLGKVDNLNRTRTDNVLDLSRTGRVSCRRTVRVHVWTFASNFDQDMFDGTLKRRTSPSNVSLTGTMSMLD